MNNAYELGKELKILRKKLNLTQKQFGNIIEKSTSQVCKFEKGQSIPNGLLVYQLNKKYDFLKKESSNLQGQSSNLQGQSSNLQGQSSNLQGQMIFVLVIS